PLIALVFRSRRANNFEEVCVIRGMETGSHGGNAKEGRSSCNHATFSRSGTFPMMTAERAWRTGGESQTVSLPRGLLARAVIVKQEGRDVAVELARLLVQAAEAAGNGTTPPPDGGPSGETNGDLGNPEPSNG